jgi:hypothetical protein
MSAVASNSDDRRLIVAGSLLCFRHEHRDRGTAFPPLRAERENSATCWTIAGTAPRERGQRFRPGSSGRLMRRYETPMRQRDRISWRLLAGPQSRCLLFAPASGAGRWQLAPPVLLSARAYAVLASRAARTEVGVGYCELR